MENLIPANVADALREQGYLTIRLTQETSDRVAAVFAAGRQFFRSPRLDKFSSQLTGDFGYRPVGIEYSSSPNHPDLAESFSVCARTNRVEFDSLKAQLLYGLMLDLFELFEPIVEDVAMKLVQGLGADGAAFRLRGGFHRWSRLQLNYSCPAQLQDSFINEPHEDGDLLTIACATGPGLELKTRGSAFSPLTVTVREALIIPGEIARLLSGGLVEPGWHCVRNRTELAERMALLFFGDLDPLLCEPWIHNHVNAGVNIGERVVKSVSRFGLSGFSD